MNELIPHSGLPSIEQPGFKIPLKDGTIYTIQEETLQMYKDVYTRIDVESEIKMYIAWAVSAPEQQKTKRGILKSVNFWLNKENKKAPMQGTTQKEYAAATTIQERVNDLSWADGL